MTRTTSRSVRRQGSIIEVRGARGTSYKLKFELPADARGERRTGYKTLKAVSRAEAEAELAKILEKVGKGVDLDAGKQSLAQWIETWLEDYGPDVSQRTIERYAQLLRGHVTPVIGHHPLAVLSPLHIERLYKQLAKRLAPRTVNHCHRVLFQCLKDAKRLRVIPDNPAADVKRRRIKQPAKGTAAQMHVLPLDQFFILLDHVKRAEFKSAPHELVLLAFDSGARRGELLALRWSDLDMEKRTIRIDRAVDETEAYGVRIKDELKNESSRRTLALSSQTIAALRDLWKRQAENHLKCGARLPDDALIFPGSIDKPREPLRPRAVTKSFGLLVKRAGFQGFRFHDLRHSCASHMLKVGRTVPEVSRHLGHANSAITLSVYSHAIPKADGDVGLLDELMPTAAE
jgi:integrase